MIGWDALSLGLLGCSLALYRRSSPSKASRLLFGLTVYGGLQLLILYHAIDSFTGDGINDAALFHVQYGFAGAGVMAYAGRLTAVAALSLAALIGSVWFAWRPPRRVEGAPRNRIIGFSSALLLALVAALLSPAASDLYALYLQTRASRVVPRVYGEFLAHYRQPTIQRLEDGRERKNLLVIYAEGLERTYLDPQAFPGLTPRLRALERRSTHFTDIRQVAGTGWTVAGLTASLCGVPLPTPGHGNSMSGMDQFMASATAFTDLLQREGYSLSFMGGGSREFAGKDKLLWTHGFSQVQGLEQLQPRIPLSRGRSPWGLYDDDLLELVYQRFVQLSAQPQPFGLFALTLDTHHPSGHMPPDARARFRYGDGSNAMLNAVARADHLIGRFVQRVLDSEHAADTIIVVLSDHLALPNEVTDELETLDRRGLLMILDPADPRPVEGSNRGSMLDVGPTLLPFLGYRGEVGLGRDLLSADPERAAEVARIHERLLDWRQPIADLWDFPRLHAELRIEPADARVWIDDRSFAIPVLIELDDSLATTLTFAFDNSEGDATLVERAEALDGGRHYVLIDRPGDLLALAPGAGGGAYGVVLATGATIHRASAVEEGYTLSAGELRGVFGLPPGFEALRVARAGGDAQVHPCEALDRGVASGFTYFELDFAFTPDDELVWTLPPAADATPCALSDLADWMKRTSSAVVVADVAGRSLAGLRVLAAALPDAPRRVIPQIGQPEDYRPVKDLGFEQVIWSLSRHAGDNTAVLDWVERLEGPLAVAMPRQRATTYLPRVLAREGVPTYVHTINEPEDLAFFTAQRGVSEVYTNALEPKGR